MAPHPPPSDDWKRPIGAGFQPFVIPFFRHSRERGNPFSSFNCLGSKLMQPIERPNPPTSELVSAYRETVFCVYGNALIDLKIGAPADMHDAWLTRIGKRSAVVITAWNPFSQATNLALNQERQQELITAVDDAALSWCNAAGKDPTGQWPPEESLCVFDAFSDTIDLWLRQFSQYAVVIAEIGKPCNLLWHPDLRLAMADPDDDQDDDDLFGQILENGQEVAYQDWDSGGPGAGAGRVFVLLHEGAFYVFHDAGMNGPFRSMAEAIASGGIDQITDATVAIWQVDMGYTFRR